MLFKDDLMSPLVSTIWLELSAEKGQKTLICGLYREFNDRAGSGQMTPNEQAESLKILLIKLIKLAVKEPI